MEAKDNKKDSPQQSTYPVSVYSARLRKKKLELQFLLPSEGLRSYRFNWYPDSRQLVDSAFQSCWERSRELLIIELGRGYLPYLVKDTGLLRWLESRRGDDEVFFMGWENAPLCEHTRTDKGEWRITGGPFRVYLQRGRRRGLRRERREYILVRIYYRSELLGPLENIFVLEKGHSPETLAGNIKRMEREKAEKSVKRLHELLGETAKSPPRLHFPEEESRVIYAYLSHFLSGEMHKAEFFLDGDPN
jgi:hypothetical protein